MVQDGKEFEIAIDDYDKQREIQEKTRSSLDRSNRVADEILNSSMSVLERLQGQRELLTRIKSGIFDISASIGISDNIIRTIDRRLTQDKWIVYGGMLGVLVLICFLYYIFG